MLRIHFEDDNNVNIEWLRNREILWNDEKRHWIIMGEFNPGHKYHHLGFNGITAWVVGNMDEHSRGLKEYNLFYTGGDAKNFLDRQLSNTSSSKIYRIKNSEVEDYFSHLHNRRTPQMVF